jgi:hypothetical protein
MIMVAYNLFHVFLLRNIKTTITAKVLANLIESEFFSSNASLEGIDSVRIT